MSKEIIDASKQETGLPKNIFDPYFEEHPEAVTQAQLNNIFCKAPGGFYREEEYLKYANEATMKLYDDMDKVIMEQGKDFFQYIKKMTELQTTHTKNKELVEAEKLQKEIKTLLLPIYRKLREMGYSHHELIS